MEMHLLANKVMLEGLTKGGLIQGTIEDMMEVRACYFCVNIFSFTRGFVICILT